MARIYTCGFENPNNYMGASQNGDLGTWKSDVKRSGTYSVLLDIGSSGTKGFNFYTPSSTTNEIYARICIHVVKWGDGGSRRFLLIYGNAGTEIARLAVNGSTSKLEYYTGGTLRLSSPIVRNVWYIVEIHLKMADAGIAEMWVDGVSAGSWSGDTLAGTDTKISRMLFFAEGGAYGNGWYFDDIAVNDTSGTVNNGRCGDGHILGMRPNGAGSTTEWTPLSGNNYENVDEIPADNDTTYIYTTENGKKDFYNITDPSIPARTSIRAVAVCATAKKLATDNSDKIKVGVLSGGVEQWSGEQTLTTTYKDSYYQNFGTNPADDEAWEPDDINNLQIGIQSVLE
jgi:hypothetical protein